MFRLACLFAVSTVAACASGFTTDAASITGTPVMSSAATSFIGADAGGNMVMGWTIDFYSEGPGADCKDDKVIPVASIGIYTSQMQDATHKKAMLQISDISIVTQSPPSVAGNAAATMGADGFSMIGGIVSISTFHLRADLSADRIEGTISAAGTDSNGTAQSLTGMFKAPVCE